ncbi:MAG: anaerobic ribonucleoside-triphosphate reductase activating protein, partial [Candidatus Thermoplasmatota archaeon]|nr:anaerobic ribonucleoside-triphosphate reductase activating protein [Candidatus Thermoplasmatota archaeon]MBU1941010.1 anaerobic ribonucleoside-triphosphate reductase activating protein [Candidatus Thermoplasmatota archaeon]
KKMGFLVKVDTNGMYPKQLENLIDHQLIDYVAMDIKAPPEKYALLAGYRVDIKKIEQSIKIIKEKAVDYEFRTTIIPKLLTKEDILSIAQWLKGAKRYYLQQYKHNVPQLNKNYPIQEPYTSVYLKEICETITPFFQTCELRGLK